MKRRKWWIIALSLALLAACVGVWKWSERPPYQFMKGSSLYMVETSKRAMITYASERDPTLLVAEAMAEFRKTTDVGFNPESFHWSIHLPGESIVQIDTPDNRDRWDLVSRFPPTPPGTKALITIYRKPTSLDHLRSFLYGLRWKGDL